MTLSFRTQSRTRDLLGLPLRVVRSPLLVVIAVLTSVCTGRLFEEYRDATGRFTVRYPSAWRASDERGARVLRADDTRSIAVSYADGRRLNQIRQPLLDQYELTGFHLISQVEQQSLGHRTLVLNVERNGWRKRQHVIETSRGVLYFDCNSEARVFTEHEWICDDVFNTVAMSEGE